MPAHGAAVEAMSVILEHPEQMRTTDVHEMDPGAVFSANLPASVSFDG